MKMLTEAVELRDQANSSILLEASGGLEGEAELKAIAATGVNYISSGALTKHVRATDFSMRFVDAP